MNGNPLRYAFLLLCCFPLFVAGQGLNDGLLLHYPLNGNADDVSANNFDGVVVGAAPVADRFGAAAGAMQFNGAARIEFPAAEALKPEPPLTLQFWVWLDDVPADGRVILTTDFLPNAFFGVTVGLTNNNRLLVSLGGAVALNTYAGATALSTGRWHHVVVIVRSVEDVAIYLSGCEETTAATGLIPVIIYSPLGVGNLGRGNAGLPPLVNTLRGRLDDVRYWDRALAEAEVQQLYGQFYTPTIELGPDTMICTGETLELRPQTTVGSYTWGDGSMTATFTVSQTGAYSVRATTIDCQEIADSIDVMVGYCDNCTPATPNAFTPNGDGQNDSFRVLFDPAKCRIVDAHVMIFNRWGKRVFETNDIEVRWDGRNDGVALPSDVYVVVVRYAYEAGPNGERITRELRSDLALLR